MRITGGKYLNRNVECPPGIIRPAMDRMRASLFSILGNNLEGLDFLDLFSGSGCVGIEAASRGAKSVDLVERDRIKKPVILKNIAYVEEPIRLVMDDALRYVTTCSKHYDIVYADPPFPLEGKVDLADKVDKAGILNVGGLFIIHYPHEERSVWPEKIGSLVFIDERTYGRSTLRFYRREN